MKIVITGASGLLGNAAAHACLRRGHDILALYHTRRPLVPEQVRCLKLDLADASALTSHLLEEFPDVIINAAAVAQPAHCEEDPEQARRLNVTLPTRIAEIANHLSARLYQLSTDLVFDGREGPYRSTDTPMPSTLYGQLKLLAERETLRAGGNFTTVLRVPVVNGNAPSGERSFHEKLFAKWAKGETPKLYTDEVRQPVSAENTGELLAELIERPNLHGLFHWAGSDTLSPFEMGLRIVRHFGLPEELVAKAEHENEPDHPRNFALKLEPLVSKVRVQPLSYDAQLHELVVPPQLAEWYFEQTGRFPDYSGSFLEARKS